MSDYQKFKVETIRRTDIQKAPYNPRLIDDANKKRLEKGIKKHGLVEPLVWNRRTGNLVSGHQRLSILDKLEKSKDYELDVSVIDVDEDEEKRLNVQLNNASMQGSYDYELLGELALDLGDSLEDLGFSDFDAEIMFGASDRFQELIPDSVAVETAKADIREIKENRARMNEKYAKEQNADYYFVVVCKDQQEKDDLLAEMSIPNTEQYISAAQLNRLRKR